MNVVAAKNEEGGLQALGVEVEKNKRLWAWWVGLRKKWERKGAVVCCGLKKKEKKGLERDKGLGLLWCSVRWRFVG